MQPETLKALKGSIRKWGRIVNGTGHDQGWENCPLCAKFYKTNNQCGGCPVKTATGKNTCDGTPYQLWSKHNTTRIVNDTQQAIAECELMFLKSLLPRGEK